MSGLLVICRESFLFRFLSFFLNFERLRSLLKIYSLFSDKKWAIDAGITLIYLSEKVTQDFYTSGQ